MNHADTVETDDGGRGVIPGRLVRLSGEPARVGAPSACEPAGPREPRVELLRDGGVVQAVDVVCPCGHRIRLRCVYAETPR
jgi:hypothetical protein